MQMEPMLDSYNDHSALQRTCQSIGNPILARMAARHAEHLRGAGAELVRIADYGCSGGRNSIAPMYQIISVLGARDPGLQFECVLEDLPSNPWHQVMAELPRLTAEHGERVRILCAGTSFFQPVCADGSVDLAYTYVAAHFLAETPPLPSHVMMHEAPAAERRPWEAQAARDWERFLVLRARELKPGGSILVSTMSRDDAGAYSWQAFSHLVWDAIRKAEAPSGLLRREVEALCIPACLRAEAELAAPFRAGSEVSALLELEALDFARTEIEHERNLPRPVLARLLRQRIEAVWGGAFVAQLQRLGRPAASARAVLGEVWDRFEQVLAREPAQGWLDMRSFYLQLRRR